MLTSVCKDAWLEVTYYTYPWFLLTTGVFLFSVTGFFDTDRGTIKEGFELGLLELGEGAVTDDVEEACKEFLGGGNIPKRPLFFVDGALTTGLVSFSSSASSILKKNQFGSLRT